MLGDLLCAVPALRAVRAGFPEAEITLVGLAWAREFAGRFVHLVDDFLELPGFPGLPETEPRVRELPAFRAAAHARHFDVAIQLHGSGRVTNTVAALLGATRTEGFGLTIPYPERGHEIHRLLALVEALGVPAQGDELEFPLRPADSAELASVAPGLEPGTYAVIHPGTRSARRWPEEGFAAVADALAAQGVRVVLTGTAGEADVTARVAELSRAGALDLTGRTSLGALAALVAGARLLVSNDTGVSHVAAALRIPSVVVVTTSDPDRWAPLDRELHRVIVRPESAEPVIAAAAAQLFAPA
jgi:ADP-heptose:LPS heptosyltransferase